MNMNTFAGANLEFPNEGLHFILAELMKFRKQLTVRPEFKSQSGWNDALNAYMQEELERIGDTLENITYNPDNVPKDELEAQASDTTRTLAQDYNNKALTADNVLLPAVPVRPVVWDLSGLHPDFPQVTPENCPNDFGRAFITKLDYLFVMLTRLDSRHHPITISKYESTMVRTALNTLYSICQRKGGEANKSDIPTGTLPSEEVRTFQGAKP
jgi:hypothetical protein